MRRIAFRPGSVLLFFFWLHAPFAVAADRPDITVVLAGRVDSLLAGMLETRGLPGREAEEVLASGLPSLLVLRLQVLELEEQGQRMMIEQVRIEPDLLEGGFLVCLSRGDRRLASLEALREHLRRLGPFPILDLGRLNPADTWRLRADLTVHPLAPPEVERVHALFTGDDRPEDRREVSISLGGLLGRILGRSRRSIEIERQSGAFRVDELPAWERDPRELDDPSPPERPPAEERN